MRAFIALVVLSLSIEVGAQSASTNSGKQVLDPKGNIASSTMQRNADFEEVFAQIRDRKNVIETLILGAKRNKGDTESAKKDFDQLFASLVTSLKEAVTKIEAARARIGSPPIKTGDLDVYCENFATYLINSANTVGGAVAHRKTPRLHDGQIKSAIVGNANRSDIVEPPRTVIEP